MENQFHIINDFCNGCTWLQVRFPDRDGVEYGEIIFGEKQLKISLETHEIHRSIKYKNGDTLFVHTLKPKNTQLVDNPLSLLIKNLKEAIIIETVYKGIFRWVFDGVFIKAYAIVPSGTQHKNNTLSRYGGTKMFIKVLRQQLNNIGKLHKGLTPDYNFLDNMADIEETEISLGSINNFNKMYSVGINLSSTYIKIIKNSKKNIQTWPPLKLLNMKYWTREINPDFIVETKRIKLKKTIPLNEKRPPYPKCLKNLMSLEHKGNFNRFLLAKFLLSVHSRKDAKFLYDMVLIGDEREHVQNGNCSTQWKYVENNMDKYSCPTCREMKKFCNTECKLAHPLEEIQKIMNKGDENSKIPT